MVAQKSALVGVAILAQISKRQKIKEIVENAVSVGIGFLRQTLELPGQRTPDHQVLEDSDHYEMFDSSYYQVHYKMIQRYCRYVIFADEDGGPNHGETVCSDFSIVFMRKDGALKPVPLIMRIFAHEFLHLIGCAHSNFGLMKEDGQTSTSGQTLPLDEMSKAIARNSIIMQPVPQTYGNCQLITNKVENLARLRLTDGCSIDVVSLHKDSFYVSGGFWQRGPENGALEFELDCEQDRYNRAIIISSSLDIFHFIIKDEPERLYLVAHQVLILVIQVRPRRAPGLEFTNLALFQLKVVLLIILSFIQLFYI